MRMSEEVRHVKRGCCGYPDRLMRHPGMPEELFFIGNLPRDDRPAIAIVGARSCSPYGRIQAFRYAKVLSEAGVQVISGLAYGIDTEGHKGALEGKTPTFAVLGTGPDICSPAGHRSVYERILRQQGGILSEYPPGTQAKPFHFPQRNRIISALSDVVLLVEAKEKSGSLITAGFALEQGKSVYAVPGAVNDLLSRGCHKLIYDGAGIAYCPEILLLEWGIGEGITKEDTKNTNLGLASDLNLLYDNLDSRPRSLDYLIRKTSLPQGVISNGLIELVLLGYIREVGRQYYVRV
ncbi:MAG: DNA-processing protein DprA [Blautia sp.]|nr:DNA-processing protein DprA [Blautia sp.]